MNCEAVSVSKRLKKARKAQGLSVKAVAQDICVQSGYLKAIENGEYDKLPAQTFAVGFVRSYATALGEDSDKIAAAFKEECGMNGPSIIASVPLEHKKQTKRLPSWLSPLAGLTGVSLVWVALGTGFGGATMVAENEHIASEVAQLAALRSNILAVAVDVAETPVGEKAEVVEAEAVFVQPKEKAGQSMSLFLPAAYAGDEIETFAPTATVLLKASEDSWVRVARQDGTELWSGILRAGQTYRPHEAGEMLLTTSNAGGLTLKQDAGATISLGDRGEIISNYSLGFENLLSQNNSSFDASLSAD